MEDRSRRSSSSSSSASAIRFLGILKQPYPDSNPFELDEADVIWSTTASDLSDSPTASDPISPARYRPENLGLSAAFSDDHRSLLQRKPSLNPSLYAASAARTIPPVPFPRSGSGSDDFSRPFSGKFLQSAPMDVPVWPRGSPGVRSSRLRVFEDVEDEEAEEEMLPPHEIVARSQTTTTLSVVQGKGRTLKGRDLRRVRNAVWQKTGFLD